MNSKTDIISPSDIMFAKQSSKFARTICNLSKLSQDILLMAIGTISTFPQKNRFAADFTVYDFMKAFKKENVSSKQFNQQMTKAVLFELAKVICYENMESIYKDGVEHYRGTAYPLFYKAEIDTTKNIHLEFNPKALENIQELKSYEIIEFDKAAKLRGKHAFNIYKYALSKQGFSGRQGNLEKTWWFDIEIGHLKAYLGVSADDYKRTSAFQTRCVREPVEDINSAGIGIRISYEPVRRGKRIVAFHFECQDLTKTARIRKSDSVLQKLQKQELNEDWAQSIEWQKMKETFPEAWEKFYGEIRESTPKGIFIEVLANKAVYEKMIEMGFRC